MKVRYVVAAVLLCALALPAAAVEKGDIKIRALAKAMNTSGDSVPYADVDAWTGYRGTPTDLVTNVLILADGTVTSEDTVGLGFDFTYMVADWIGIDAGVSFGNFDMNLSEVTATYGYVDPPLPPLGSGSFPDDFVNEIGPTQVSGNLGTLSATPLALGVSFHLSPGKWDLYATPQYVYTFYGDLNYVTDPAQNLLDELQADVNKTVPSEPATPVESGSGFGITLGADWQFSKYFFASGQVQYMQSEAKIDFDFGEQTLGMDLWMISLGAGIKF